MDYTEKSWDFGNKAKTGITVINRKADGKYYHFRDGRWPRGIELMSRNPEGRGSIPRLGRKVVAHQHWARWTTA